MSLKLASWSPVVLSVLLAGVAGCDTPQNTTPPPINTTPVAPPMPTAGEDSASRAVPEGFTQTDSGLRYKIITEGAGEKPTVDNQVTAKYRGWLDNGEQFDAGEIGPFHLKGGPGGVIAGWNEGIQLIGVGGKVELEIPPGLAYGPGGQGPIPPNSWLHFDVELVKVH
ncbi:MAG TPA: FKBP-type peptidyl-prolyl cis-trans isomerase [Planctomycetaceae bacterium]|nr:FKBP-type peptidyl-prolyl cis-trans isomerase [Planctomycetaceae bacterium]